MLSNPLHRYPPYTNTSASTIHSPYGQNDQFGSFSHGSHYGVNQLEHHVGPSNSRGTGHISPQGHHTHRAKPSGSTGKVSGASGPVRRRISRACDQCNQLRTKCDGKHPCAHCIEFGLGCEYMREKKKRGKASRKDLAERAAAQAAAGSANQNGDVSDGKESSNSPATDEKADGFVENTRSNSMSSSGLATVHDNHLGGEASVQNFVMNNQHPPRGSLASSLASLTCCHRFKLIRKLLMIAVQ
ncbi:hypothetical protein J3459_016323 [Metarhizium acridum]|nr:hypothetical protein J3459_016323 [Metarhizium acridum]